MGGRTPPTGGARDSTVRTEGKGLRGAYDSVSRWLTSPAVKGVVRFAYEGVKLYVRLKGIDIDLR